MNNQSPPKSQLSTRSNHEIPEISCVIPAYNESGNIGLVIEAIAKKMQRLKRSYEMIVVDDGSRDDTVEQAKNFLSTYPLRLICLSRNFGKEDAIMAGLEASRGKAVIVIDADMQEPVGTIRKFVQYWEEGYDMVFAVRAHRNDESFLKNVGSKAFYWILDKMTQVHIPPDARDFRLMDRKVVDAVCNLPEKNRFMKGLFSWVGFKTKKIEVVIDDRQSGESSFNYRRLIGLALTGITAFSNWPLRVWTSVGFIISSASILYAMWIIIRTLVWGVVLPGWATLTVAVFFLGGIQILSIGVIGEYLARIYTEVKGRPGHIVAEEFSYLDTDPS